MTFPIGAMPTIEIDEKFFRDLGVLESIIDILSYSFNDFSEPLRQSLDDVILPSIDTNFDRQGRPPWKSLAEATVKTRKASGPILDRTGSLRGEATNPSNWDITTNDLSMINLGVTYGVYHQTGTSKMPARPFVMYQPQDIAAIEEIFGLWVDVKIAAIWDE